MLQTEYKTCLKIPNLDLFQLFYLGPPAMGASLAHF